MHCNRTKVNVFFIQIHGLFSFFLAFKNRSLGYLLFVNRYKNCVNIGRVKNGTSYINSNSNKFVYTFSFSSQINEYECFCAIIIFFSFI